MLVAPMLIIKRRKSKYSTHYNREMFSYNEVLKLNYVDTHSLFYKSSGGPIKTDAQFCKLIYDNCGEGEYLVLAFTKGKRGFYNFYHVMIHDYGFQRIKKRSAYQKENRDIDLEIRHNKLKLNKINDNNEIKELHEEIDSLEEEKSLNKEIEQSWKKRAGPSPFLEQKKPVYQLHSYENIYPEDSNHVKREETMW